MDNDTNRPVDAIATLREVRLNAYNNSWYSPGRGLLVRTLWYIFNRLFFQTSIPWPSSLKRILLRVYGARVGKGVVIKPRVNIKYPWNLEIGDYSWIGEEVWIDSLTTIQIGSNVCVSQGVLLETGNHDWTDPHFGLKVTRVELQDGSWAAARAVLLPGSCLAAHSVLAAGAVLSGATAPNSIYGGNPAVRLGERTIRITDNEIE